MQNRAEFLLVFPQQVLHLKFSSEVQFLMFLFWLELCLSCSYESREGVSVSALFWFICMLLKLAS